MDIFRIPSQADSEAKQSKEIEKTKRVGINSRSMDKRPWGSHSFLFSLNTWLTYFACYINNSKFKSLKNFKFFIEEN